MPSSYAHYREAECVYERLPSEVKQRVADFSLYLLGSQGGDFGFFYPELSFSQPNMGKLLHTTEACALFSDMAEYCGVHPEAFSFAAGFVTHYCLDAAFHPLVYREGGKNYFFHASFERSLDAYLAERNALKEEFSIRTNLLSYGQLKTVCGLLDFVFERRRKSFSAIEERKLRAAYRFFDFATIRLVKFISRPFSAEEIDKRREKWDELFSFAVSSGDVCMRALYKKAFCSTPLDKELFARDFSGKII